MCKDDVWARLAANFLSGGTHNLGYIKGRGQSPWDPK